MGRLHLAPENQLSQRVKDLLDGIEDLKTKQALGGDSIRRYFGETGATWDVTLVVPAGVATYTWRVTYTVDHPKNQPFVEGRVYSQWSPAGTNQSVTLVDDPANVPGVGNKVVLIGFFNLSGEATTLNLRFTFNAGDTGAITFVRLT